MGSPILGRRNLSIIGQTSGKIANRPEKTEFSDSSESRPADAKTYAKASTRWGHSIAARYAQSSGDITPAAASYYTDGTVIDVRIRLFSFIVVPKGIGAPFPQASAHIE